MKCSVLLPRYLLRVVMCVGKGDIMSLESQRVCLQCKRALPNTSFHRRPTAKDGLSKICKACHFKRIRLVYSSDTYTSLDW
ncbi:hypothetical protein LCGC14_1981100 [marine sediment metagenome]|uniref:Uncharacterized protein n=1 Tax=marine sediment metagenome TaxID=412755 RepID=A0A0F9F8W4_9ZZZZ